MRKKKIIAAVVLGFIGCVAIGYITQKVRKE